MFLCYGGNVSFYVNEAISKQSGEPGQAYLLCPYYGPPLPWHFLRLIPNPLSPLPLSFNGPELPIPASFCHLFLAEFKGVEENGWGGENFSRFLKFIGRENS